MIKDQDFEREYAKTTSGERKGLALPDELAMADLIEFNTKVMGQVWAQLNPSQFQPGFNQKEDPIEFTLEGSTKNYLLVPLRICHSVN